MGFCPREGDFSPIFWPWRAPDIGKRREKAARTLEGPRVPPQMQPEKQGTGPAWGGAGPPDLASMIAREWAGSLRTIDPTPASASSRLRNRSDLVKRQTATRYP